MAVSRSLRFQILRRDNHTCRYCGRSAPEVKLTVDHVVPEALGGSDDPTNLVAACSDCNAGKSATPPDAAHVAQVGADALRWAEAIRVAADAMLADIDEHNERLGEFDQAWRVWTFGEDKLQVPRPDTWERSVDAMLAAGLPLAVLLDCLRYAMGNQRVAAKETFRYMCGMAWRRVSELQDAARLAVQDVDSDSLAVVS